MDYSNIIFVDVFEKDRTSYMLIKSSSNSDEVIKYNTKMYKEILKNMKTITNIEVKNNTKIMVEFGDGYNYKYESFDQELIRRVKLRFEGLKLLNEELNTQNKIKSK